MYIETDQEKIKEQLAKDRERRQKKREAEAAQLGIPVEHLDRKPWYTYNDDDKLTSEEKFEKYVDSLDIPGSMDDGLARVLYIVVMAVGIIFVDRWLIWIAATAAYLCHVFRRELHTAKWNREHKNKK